MTASAGVHDVNVRVSNRLGGSDRLAFVRVGQCQVDLPLPDEPNTDEGLYASIDPGKQTNNLLRCLEVASSERVQLLILPELALAIPEASRQMVIGRMDAIAQSTGMLIVAGSYYDASRYNRLVVIGPGWHDLGYKVRPSRYEVSPNAGRGMTPGLEMLVISAPQGNLAIFTCVDLISDEVQYQVRRLATEGKIDLVINVNDNPAALEFLLEANSLVRRHPVFATITNVAKFGHTALFADLRGGRAPDSAENILSNVPEALLAVGGKDRHLAFDHVVADLPSGRSALLISELNLRMQRVPLTTNAPDQGYPPVRGIGCVDLTTGKACPNWGSSRSP